MREELSELHETAVQQPKKVGVRYRLGLLALQLDRFDLARVWFQATLAINPRRAKALRNLQPERQDMGTARERHGHALY